MNLTTLDLETAIAGVNLLIAGCKRRVTKAVARVEDLNGECQMLDEQFGAEAAAPALAELTRAQCARFEAQDELYDLQDTLRNLQKSLDSANGAA